VRRLAVAERQLREVAAALRSLHPDAAAELERAGVEAVPTLHAQAERLAVLHRLSLGPAGPAADAAKAAAAEVAARLARGVDACELLLAAAATTLGSPDLARSAEDVIGPAVDGLLAYAHGLSTAAERP